MPKVIPAETCMLSICERVQTLEATVKALSDSVVKICTTNTKEPKPSYAAVVTAPREINGREMGNDKQQKHTSAQSHTSKTPRDNNSAIDDYEMVQRRRRERPPQNRRPPIKGTASSSKLRGAPEPSRDLFVYRVTKETVQDDLMEYLKDKHIQPRDIEKLSNTEAKFSSFRVEVKVSELDTLLDPNFWPEGVCVRRFYRKK